jgi:hypothetical protein
MEFDGPACRHPAEPGLWAVEPHIGFCGVGVKWEELLVVTEDDAYWLDDNLPHVRRFEALSAETTGALNAETTGALSAETTGALSAETTGAQAATARFSGTARGQA